MRLEPQPGELLDRSREVTFRFGSQAVRAFEGDTFGSALYASGRRVFSRSFKYHRPRGLLCCAGHCANCLMTVDGVPNVRVCAEPVRAGAVVEGQNALGSIDRDFLSVVDKAGGPFTPVGFYYRTMIRPRRAWPLYEKALRSIAGLGKVGGESRRYDKEHRRARVLVLGGGRSGREAALAAAAEGPGVVLVDEGLRRIEIPGVEVVAGRALAIYEGGLVPVEAGTLLLRYRAERIVVATGTIEQPLVFPGNDLVGVLLPGAARRLVGDWAIKPGERAVVIGGEDAVESLERAGVEIAEVADPASLRSISARGSKGRLAEIELDGRRIDCDLAVVSGGRQPAYSLLAQAGARVEYDSASRVFVPRDLPAGIAAVGSVTGGGSTAAPSYCGVEAKGRCFVCVCEDVTEKDVERAIAEGFESIELSKRYTTVTMGPCQGKFCQLGSIRLHAAKTGADEAAIGTTTARPPWAPVELGLLAGRHHDPMRRTSLHHRHEEAGADMVWAGPWQRPHSYGDPAAEIAAVHSGLGVIDVSTLGKLIVEGPDAATFLERLYPNRFADLAEGRVRYTVLGSDGGRILDDGTVARLGPDLFYVTTTSTGADAVHEWFDWWNAGWGYEVDVVNVTGALAALNLAGPRAREALGPLTDADVSAEAFRYLDAKWIEVAGVRALALRIGFVGELGYELHFASPAGEHVWDTLIAAGARPFGLEPQRVLRLEKQHVIVGQDTDTESNLFGAGMDWLPKMDKDDFVGKWALEHADARERLVGFRMDVLPLEGAQVVRDGRSVGRVTSARTSVAAGGVIGLAWVPPELAVEDAELHIRVDGTPQSGRVCLRPFHDPEGERMRA
ncbi:MAG TPA: 2Fe-2S iron-sulfur cluster-binding protein [Gaiellaceae bacterium]|nr:2Fe-2S iron-sulfur cluster-binding protein [Gaiellaceae bacterium]